MLSTEVTGLDLFAPALPNLEQLEKLTLLINASEANQIEFEQQLRTCLGKNDAASVLAGGIGLVIVGRFQQAIERLEKAKDCVHKLMYLAYALRMAGRFDNAIKYLDKAADMQVDKLKIAIEKAAALRYAKRYDEAEKILKNCAKYERISADYHYQLGRLFDAKGLYQLAQENYKLAIELDPNHQKALFQLAFASDLRGDDEAAIEYYTKITANTPVYVNALLNLAVIYEDCGEYDKAIKCIAAVLNKHPNHPRALLFKQDVESSETMYYDEEKERKLDRRNQILEIPISDFELSVRSRNCLRKMNLRTIGDLLRISETELLAYKNFGETSLTEIKAILASKNLRLGMAIEDKSFAMPQPAAAQGASDELRNKSVDDFELSVRARKCLQSLNIRTVGELINRTEAELLGCKNFGVTSLNEIKERLAATGLALRSLE